MDDRQAEIHELEERIADLYARLPKHSTPPNMLIELDELKERLEELRAEAKEEAE